MHAGRHYTLKEDVTWTGRDILVFATIACLPVVMCMFDVPLPPLPWAPVAVLGTAVAFVTGFKSNAAYGRLWEARKIWGAILNASRSFTIHLREYVGDRDDGVVRSCQSSGSHGTSAPRERNVTVRPSRRPCRRSRRPCPGRPHRE